MPAIWLPPASSTPNSASRRERTPVVPSDDVVRLIPTAGPREEMRIVALFVGPPQSAKLRLRPLPRLSTDKERAAFEVRTKTQHIDVRPVVEWCSFGGAKIGGREHHGVGVRAPRELHRGGVLALRSPIVAEEIFRQDDDQLV